MFYKNHETDAARRLALVHPRRFDDISPLHQPYILHLAGVSERQRNAVFEALHVVHSISEEKALGKDDSGEGEQRADRGRWSVRSLRDYYALCGNSVQMKQSCAQYAKLADKVLRDFEGGSDTNALVGREQYYAPRRSIV